MFTSCATSHDFLSFSSVRCVAMNRTGRDWRKGRLVTRCVFQSAERAVVSLDEE